MQTLFFLSKFAYCLWNPPLSKALAVKRLQMKSQYWCCYVILHPLGYRAGFTQCLGLLPPSSSALNCAFYQHTFLSYDPGKDFSLQNVQERSLLYSIFFLANNITLKLGSSYHIQCLIKIQLTYLSCNFICRI